MPRPNRSPFESLTNYRRQRKPNIQKLDKQLALIVLPQIITNGRQFASKILMNYPVASCEVSQERDGKYPKGVTPECFYRGPLKHAGMTVFGKKTT